MRQGKVGNLGELDSGFRRNDGKGLGGYVWLGRFWRESHSSKTSLIKGEGYLRGHGGVEHPHPFDKLRAGSNFPPSVGGREGGRVGLTVGEDGKILA